MIEAPCKWCEHKGCGLFHSKCEAYQEFKIKQKQEKDRIYAAKNKETAYSSYRNSLRLRANSLRSPENSPVKGHRK